MKLNSIEYRDEIDALVMSIDGAVQVDEFLEIYAESLRHGSFHKGVNYLWNARNAKIRNLTLGDIGTVLDNAKSTWKARGSGCSAWVFSNVEDYRIGCMAKACFGPTLPIRYEVFNNVIEAEDWLKLSVSGSLSLSGSRPRII